jgi:hypothetical protein
MKFRNILLVSAAVLICAASISATTIEHTFVSGSGIDSNACTFASPCLTFTGALAKTTAGGLITAKDTGDFGAVTIGKSVTIDGANMGSITFRADNGIYITASANVIVQNLTINGLGAGANGIYVINGGIVTVHNCEIMNIILDGILFAGAGNLTVENSRIESFIGSNLIGIGLESNAAENVVVRNTVIDASPVSNSNYGFVVQSNSGSVIKVSLQNVTIMGAGYEAVLIEAGLTQITGSVITQSGVGVEATGASTISVASSLITANTTGICSNSGAKIRLDNNDIYDNPTAIANCGGIVKTSTTNKTSGTISIPAADVSDSVTF